MADEVATDPGAAAPTVTQPQNDVPADAQRPQTIEAAVDNIVDPPAPTVDEVTPQPAVDPTTPAEDVLPGTTAPPVTELVPDVHARHRCQRVVVRQARIPTARVR